MDTVAVILRDGTSVIIPTEEAVAEYNRLDKLELVQIRDQELFAALKVGIGILPKISLGLGEDGRTRAEYLIEKWKQDFPNLNS